MTLSTTPSSRRWSALALIVTAQFMVILDVAIVNVALPSIKSDLGFSATSLQWVVSAYAILFGGALLLGGRLADLIGRRRLFVTGLLVFAASSLLCGLAWSEASLIAFRAVHDFGDGEHLIVARELDCDRCSAAAGLARLTARERQILQLVANGRSAAVIAEMLVLSPLTVKTHLNNIRGKLGVHDRAAAVAEGMRFGLIE